MAQTLFHMVHFSDPEWERVTRGSLYKFAMLNSPQNSHLGKLSISPTWRIHFCSNLWGWKEDISGYLSDKFQTVRIRNFGDTAESISDISAEKIRKLGLTVPGASCHYFQKRSTLDNSPWRGPSFYPIRSLKFQVLKIRVSLTNPRSTRFGTKIDISNR